MQKRNQSVGVARNKTDIFLLIKESKRKKLSRYFICDIAFPKKVLWVKNSYLMNCPLQSENP